MAHYTTPPSQSVFEPRASASGQQRQQDPNNAAVSDRAAAQRLAHPRQVGTLRLAYRRSTMALGNVVERLLPGSTSGAAQQSQRRSEQEPLLAQEERASTSYGAVGNVPPEQRVPKPKAVKSPVRVEAKVWFANERTWISWLRVSLLIGSFSLAMFNSASHFESSPREPVPPGQEPGPVYASPNAGMIRTFAILYAMISVLTLSWGLFNYHRRVYLIRTKFPGNFDDLIGPPVICAALFIAVLLNFIVRVQQHNFDEGV